MNEQAKLLCNLIKETSKTATVASELQDGTPFQIEVSKHYIGKIEGDGPPRCWLLIEYSGERDGIAQITLPEPIIEQGRKITVKTNRIQRSVAPRKMAQKPKILLKKGVEGLHGKIHQAGDVLAFDAVYDDRGYWIIVGQEGYAIPFDCAEIIKN